MAQTRSPKTGEALAGSTAVEPEEIPYTEKRQILHDGVRYPVEVQFVRGQAILVQSVYKEVPLPNSKKTTKVLVAAAGSVVQGY